MNRLLVVVWLLLGFNGGFASAQESLSGVVASVEAQVKLKDKSQHSDKLDGKDTEESMKSAGKEGKKTSPENNKLKDGAKEKGKIDESDISDIEWKKWLEESRLQFGVGVSGKLEKRINALDKSNLLDDPGGVLAEEELNEGL